MIASFGKIAEAFETGEAWYSYLFKVATPAPGTTGYFVDCNQSSGTPKYNPLSGLGLEATQLIGQGNGGIYVGPYSPGKAKHLARWQMRSYFTNGAPLYAYLMDYLLFYSLIDGDDSEVQSLMNPANLPRYADGEGVRIILVVTAPSVQTAPCTITYTNSKGVANKTVTFNIVPGAGIGVCATGTGGATLTVPTPFFPLAAGDTGVRSVQSVQFTGTSGGFFCLALVKPIAEIPIYETLTPVEKVYGINEALLPEILPGAYLNLMLNRGAGTIEVGQITSEFIFINA